MTARDQERDPEGEILLLGILGIYKNGVENKRNMGTFSPICKAILITVYCKVSRRITTLHSYKFPTPMSDG